MYASRILVLIIIISLFVNPTAQAYAQDRLLMPLGPHCGSGGPLPIQYCGCTWGEVYYRGRPLAGANVTLQFGTQMTHTLAQKEEGAAFPFYDTSGAKLGATRACRALPDSKGEQQVTLVLPQQGVWTPWITGGYTRTLAVNEQTLWAGGPAGLLAVNITSGVSATQSLPWTDPAVTGVASDGNNSVWAMGPHNLAEFDGATWQNRPTPFAATLRALVVHPATGALWLGGGDSTGALAVYDGAWHAINVVGERVTILLVDSANNVWVGTSGGGLYRHAGNVADLNSGWTQFRINDGLASDYILSAATSGNQVWFGTSSYLIEQGYRGGIGRYNLADNTWRTYAIANGLPALPSDDPALAQAPAFIFALAVDAQGTPWAGTADGIYRLATPDTWAKHVTTGGDAVRALITSGATLIAARTSGHLDRLDPDVIPGNPPTAQLAAVITPTLTQLGAVTLTASAMDQDGNADPTNTQILAWDWQSNRDGPLCTTAAICTISGRALSLRVQDDEGVWSQPVSTKITVTQVATVYLPVINR